ncbi:MAG TPA: lysine--tRNA ligase [Thermoplasmata archaeon]|nr:lysine--tRNA ligase [Thermoplasmata archaeon]
MENASHLERERRAKVERLRAAGQEPFPWEFPDRSLSGVVRAACARLGAGEDDRTRAFRVAGRLRSVREHGKTAFADLVDADGELQLLLRADLLGETGYRSTLADLDPGDIVGAEGWAAVSRRGEPSLEVGRLILLAKAIAPPPEKYHGLQDAETKLRRRYLDLLASPESRQRFRVRTALLTEIRRFFDDAGFLEVETPVLLPVASGAAAAPFVTRSNYLGSDLQLRIALELPLKRLLVGGLEKVYELGKAFRNEDLDSIHSPEFTELEAYWAYADYRDMRRLIERLFERLAGRTAELLPDDPAAARGAALFRPPYATVDFVEELERRSGIDGVMSKSREELRELAHAAGSTVPDASSTGTFLDKLFEKYVEPTFDRLTFVVDHPQATTPLAKRHRAKPGRVERFEVFVPGFELGNAYTELNDPDEQERRFREQLGERGDDRYAYDEDFVQALRYGLPPTTGVGIGVDRMLMALTGTPSIKEVLLFPLVRPTPASGARTEPPSRG